MTTETIEPTVHDAMARFRASLLRRASAVGWVVLIIVGAQAVRSEGQVFTRPGFYYPMAAMSLLLVVATATRWERIMATGAAPWISSGWLIGLIVGITALGTIPELTGSAA